MRRRAAPRRASRATPRCRRRAMRSQPTATACACPRGRGGAALCGGHARAARARARRCAARVLAARLARLSRARLHARRLARPRAHARHARAARRRGSRGCASTTSSSTPSTPSRIPGHEVVWRRRVADHRPTTCAGSIGVRRARHRARREPEHVRAHGALAPACGVPRARRVARRLDDAGRRPPPPSVLAPTPDNAAFALGLVRELARHFRAGA